MYIVEDGNRIPDESFTIWRYLDFEKFMDVIIRNQLFLLDPTNFKIHLKVF